MRYLHLYNMAFGWVSRASLLQQLHGWDMPWVLWQWVYETKFDFTSAISPLVPYRPRVSYWYSYEMKRDECKLSSKGAKSCLISRSSGHTATACAAAI